MTATTTGRDVNAEFDAQRAGQIAAIQAARADLQARIADYESGAAQAALDKMITDRTEAGEIADMGNGTYRVLVGYDRGEIFAMNRATRPGELALVEPQAGLDFDELGNALGYFTQPEWHGLGTVIPGGTTDIGEILAVSGGDYEVTKRISRAFDSTGALLENGEGYQTVREGGGRAPAILGQVGTRWTAFQNGDAFGFLADVLGKREILPVSAFPLRGGRVFAVALRLPEDVHIDAGGIDDVVRPYIVARNSFDGRTPFQCVATPWRPRCSNTERLAMANAHTRWAVPHFRNGLARIEEARKTLGLTVAYYEAFTAEETTLARTELTARQIDELLDELDAELWPDKTDGDEQTKRQESTRTERTVALRDIAGAEFARAGRTAYGLERAYTDYLDHAAPRRIKGMADGAARATAIVEGAEDDRKARVHGRLMLLANR